MTTITYKFQETYLTPNPEELEKRLVTITSDGNISVSNYNGRKLISKKKSYLTPEIVEDLITDMKKYESPAVYLDATSSAKIVFDDGSSIAFNPAPGCLADFIDKFCDEMDL